jgi:hypothetical protein
MMNARYLNMSSATAVEESVFYVQRLHTPKIRVSYTETLQLTTMQSQMQIDTTKIPGQVKPVKSGGQKPFSQRVRLFSSVSHPLQGKPQVSIKTSREDATNAKTKAEASALRSQLIALQKQIALHNANDSATKEFLQGASGTDIWVKMDLLMTKGDLVLAKSREQRLRRDLQVANSCEDRANVLNLRLEQVLATLRQEKNRLAAGLKDDQANSMAMEISLTEEQEKSRAMQLSLTEEQAKSRAMQSSLTAMKLSMTKHQEKSMALVVVVKEEEQKVLILRRSLATEKEKSMELQARLTREETKRQSLATLRAPTSRPLLQRLKVINSILTASLTRAPEESKAFAEQRECFMMVDTNPTSVEECVIMADVDQTYVEKCFEMAGTDPMSVCGATMPDCHNSADSLARHCAAQDKPQSIPVQSPADIIESLAANFRDIILNTSSKQKLVLQSKW